jgi:hypothetical protein
MAKRNVKRNPRNLALEIPIRKEHLALRLLFGIRFPDVQKKTSGSKNPAVFSVFPGTGNMFRHFAMFTNLPNSPSVKVRKSL